MFFLFFIFLHAHLGSFTTIIHHKSCIPLACGAPFGSLCDLHFLFEVLQDP